MNKPHSMLQHAEATFLLFISWWFMVQAWLQSHSTRPLLSWQQNRATNHLPTGCTPSPPGLLCELQQHCGCTPASPVCFSKDGSTRMTVTRFPRQKSWQPLQHLCAAAATV